MWILQSLKDDDVKFYLLCGVEYTVGRKDVNIIIENDPSVSRKHAMLYCCHLESKTNDPGFIPMIKIRDLGSKYGIKHNGRTIQDSETFLNNGDTVSFGPLGSDYVIRYEPLIVSTSCLQNQSKKLLQGLLVKLGGHLVQEWTSDCSLLVMDPLMLTVKTACALISQKPIVKLQYFESLTQAIQNRTVLPDPQQFLPDVKEPILNVSRVRFGNQPERKDIFRGKTFYFFERKQFKKLKPVISLGGGNSVLVENSEISPRYLKEDAHVFRPAEGDKHPVLQYLHSHSLRSIPESDVGLAVAYCSTAEYCNPKSISNVSQAVNFVSQSLSTTQNLFLNSVRAEETPVFQVAQTSAQNSSITVPNTVLQRTEELQTNTSVSSEVSSDNQVTDTSVESHSQNSNSNIDMKPSLPILQQPAASQNGISTRGSKKKSSSSTIGPLDKFFSTSRKRTSSESECTEEGPVSKSTKTRERAENNDFAKKRTRTTSNDEESPSTKLSKIHICEGNEGPHTQRLADVKEEPLSDEEPSTTCYNPCVVDKIRTNSSHSGLVSEQLDRENQENISAVNVEFAELICKKKKTLVNSDNTDDTNRKKVNFKKFKKFHKPNLLRPPIIIGGRDLVVFKGYDCEEF